MVAAGLVAALTLWGSLPATGTVLIGVVAVAVLAVGLARGSGWSLGAGLALLGALCVGANGEATMAAIGETAALVVVAELAWWSLDLRPAMPSASATLGARWLIVGAVACGAVSAAGWVLVAGRLDAGGVVGPLVGAVGAISLAALGWGLDRSR